MSESFPNFHIENFLKEYQLDFKIHDSGSHKEYAICCPECVNRGEPRLDYRFRLWINSKNGVFYCYNCDWSGQLSRFVESVCNVDLYGALKILRGRPLNPLEHLSIRLDSGDLGWYEEVLGPEENLKELEFPFGYQPIKSEHEYLKKRGIPLSYAMANEWGFSDVGYCKGRIIVPTFMDNKMVFWQARATWEGSGKDFKKVLNPKGVSARSVLYNYDKAKEFEQIIIVEGFMDAAKTGDNVVATNGKALHSQQVDWLRKTEAKEVVLLWDADAWTDQKYYRDGKNKGKLKHPSSIERAAALLKMFFKVRAVRMPEGIDPGKLPMRHPIFEKIINNAREI